jgi:hypothetical protein
MYCNKCNDDIIRKFIEHDHFDNHEQPFVGNVEVVDFKQFCAMGMKHQFAFVGLLQFDGNEMLNFTHRATLGGGDNGDQNVGKYK